MRITDLRETYADLFSPRFRGFECGDGWASIAEEMLAELRSKCPDAKIVQAKEKLGGFRIYLEKKLDEDARTIVRRAEAKSFTLCEICGAPGGLRRLSGNICVRCDRPLNG